MDDCTIYTASQEINKKNIVKISRCYSNKIIVSTIISQACVSFAISMSVWISRFASCSVDLFIRRMCSIKYVTAVIEQCVINAVRKVNFYLTVPQYSVIEADAVRASECNCHHL